MDLYDEYIRIKILVEKNGWSWFTRNITDHDKDIIRELMDRNIGLSVTSYGQYLL